MTVTIEAIYVNGVFQPKQPVQLAEGTQVELIVHTDMEPENPFKAVIGTCDGPLDGAANHDKDLF
jgi:predicted DNA-binding antitoxin AbrB/MazE fold protein